MERRCPAPAMIPVRDGIHGEDAGGEGEAETQGEEGSDADPEPLAAGAAASLSLLACPARRCPEGWPLPPGRGGEGLDGDPFVGRWVAESPAALVTQGEAGRVPDPGPAPRICTSW